MNLIGQNLQLQFFLRPGKSPAFGIIYARLSYAGVVVELGTTGIRLPTLEWDIRRRQVKPSSPKAEAINRELNRLAERVDTAYLDLLRRGKENISVHIIKAHFLDAQTGPLTMHGAVSWWLELKKKEVGTRITKSTYQTFSRWGRNVQAFLDETKLSHQLADEFTPAIADRMVQHLVQVKGYVPAYTNKHLDVVRSTLRAAHEAERISRNPLKRYADLPEDEPDTTFLDPDELARIEALTDLSPRLEKVRDFLLAAVELGTHYVDYARIRQRGRIETDPDGTRWVVSERQKTGKAIDVPVSPRLDRLLEKYGGLANLPLLANAQLNAFLKVLAERAQIVKNVTTKIGRKTFADTRLNREGLSDTATARMLGLTSPAYLGHYGTVRRDRLKKEINARKGGE